MKKSLAVMLALIMVLCMIPTTALAVPPGEQSVTIKLAYSDYVYEPTGSKEFTYTYSNPLQGGTGWIYTLGPVEQYVTSQEMSGYNFTGYIVMEKGKRVSKMPGDTWDLGQGNGGMLHVQLQKNNDTPTSSTLQVNTVINGDQTLKSSGTPFSVTVGNGYTPDDYKTGLDNSNYTYTFVRAERNSGKGLFKLTASSSGTTYADSKFRQFFPASGENVVAVYYTAKSKAAPTPSAIPSQPDANTLKSLLGKIKVTCVTDTAHGTEEFDLIDGSYTVGAVGGNATSGYTCEVSISPDKYVEAYNAELSLVHTTEDTAKIVTLKYNSGAWALNDPSELPVEFNVQCETEQPTPSPSAIPSQPDADTLKDLLGNIKVTCVTNGTTHGPKEFNLLAGSYTVGNVEGSANSGYTCDITVRPELYVAEYVKDLKTPHTLSPAGQTGTITLIYYAENQAWGLMPNYVPIVFNVTCSDEDKTFTVTYLDGFSGTYATYTNLKSGVVTPVPANPYRSGYIFLGWEPSVAPTVTGDARYVAQWGYIGPQYPNPTPVQPVQPGILPPQTGDMPLWYAIARFLGLVK